MSYSYSTVLSSACDYVLDCASGSHWLAHVGVPQLFWAPRRKKGDSYVLTYNDYEDEQGNARKGVKKTLEVREVGEMKYSRAV